MAPALKVKRLKKSIKPKSSVVANTKPKWEKPKKAISAQAKVAKIKNVNKRSFDPIKANRGVVLLKNIPHGFYEDEMRKYFGQFGLVTRVHLARSERTGRSKGYAFIEFKVPEVAQIAADTMNNYIMFKHVLKTVYIPPDKQTYNFFRKDATFNADANGQISFTSDKIKSIENEIEKINRVPTDEEHARRLKRTEKTLLKQQKKYGIDLTNVMVSGNNDTGETVSTIEVVKPKDKKKQDKVAKKTIDKPAKAKVDAIKVEKKKEVLTKKDKKKVDSKASSNGGKSLLSGLLNETYETDTSDDDFKIDHSFNTTADDSDESSTQEYPSLVDLLGKKLSSKNKAPVDSEDEESDDDLEFDDDSDDDLDDDMTDSDDDLGSDDDEESDDDEMESEDDTPEIVVQAPKGKKKPNGRIMSNGAVNAKGKAALKRKLHESAESFLKDQLTSSSQSELETVAKKKKQVQNKRKLNLPNVETSTSSEPETIKVPTKRIKQKKHQPNEFLRTSITTSSSEPESIQPQKKFKKVKPVESAPKSAVLTTSNPSKPDTKKQQKTKKKALNLNSSSSIADTTSSEPEAPQKNKKKKNSKLLASGPITQTNAEVEKVKPGKQVKQQPAKHEKSKTSTPESPPSKSNVKNQNLNKKQKIVANDEFISLKPEPVNVEKKKKKLKPVTSSLISDNGFSKKANKPTKTKGNPEKSTDKSATAWSTVSETDGENTKKPKAAGKANLKTIVHKNVPKKKNDIAKHLDVKKIKQTPDELLQLISSKELKQSNKLKSKKKSK